MENTINDIVNTSAMPTELLQKLNTLSEKEELYFRAMYPKSGVLYITAKPGVAKSAILRNIANKMGYAYIDMRLSMNDETDFKFPFLTDEVYNGVSYKVSGTAIPQWAFEANKRPTIINFEELNRAPLFVRNAALQILLERSIGGFHFNEDVLMVACGNLGDEDGTDVEEFDSALKNRLIHYKHTLSKDEWMNDFAIENVHPLVCSFINSYPERLAEDPNANSNAYATPRSWTFLSDWIVSNYGMKSNAKEFQMALAKIAGSFIGTTATKFIQYCNEMVNISIMDIVDNYPNVKVELEKYKRDKKEELLNSLKEYKLVNFNDVQLENIGMFLKSISADTLTAYLIYVVDKSKETNNPRVRDFLRKHFLADLIVIAQRNDNQE